MTSPETMLDHMTIRLLLERYCRGVDRLDADLLNSVYWPEATDNHGLYVGPGSEFAAWLLPQNAEAYLATMHCLYQSNLDVRGDVAAGDTYFICYQRAAVADGIALEISMGRYVDRFEKRGGEWRIIDRTVVMEHVHVQTGLGEPHYGVGDFTQGRRDRGDLSYRMFGLGGAGADGTGGDGRA